MLSVFPVLSGSSSPNHLLGLVDGNVSQSVGAKISPQTMHSKDQERLRPGSTGHHMTPMAPPGPSSSFPRPIYPVPLLSHVPMVRPPPQLHPNVVQRMLAQGIPPQQLGPALMQAGLWFLPAQHWSYFCLITFGLDIYELRLLILTRYVSTTC